MRRVEFAPCLPSRGTKVPAGPDWIHEIKHDGYRLTVHREGKRVRLFTRNGHDWTDRYPLIVEAALRNRIASFVMDGEAVLLGVDGRSDFDGLHIRKFNDEVQFYAFDQHRPSRNVPGQVIPDRGSIVETKIGKARNKQSLNRPFGWGSYQPV